MYLTPKTHFYSTVKLKTAKVKNDGNFITHSFLPGFAETQVLSDLSYFSFFFFPSCRYIMLDLRGLPFQNITSLPGQISAQVPSNISIYGISLIVKRELGPCTLNIRIYQPRETGDKEEMEASMKLRDFGYVGTLPPHEPKPVTLFYDYDYPMLDCPLLMADFSV